MSARSEAARELALDHLDGRVSALLGALRQPIVAALAEVEARLDFATHEDVGALPEGLTRELHAVAARMRGLAATVRAGRARIDGLRVALYGAPNAGKSTLFNALVGDDRALVHAEPGTTRDVVEARTFAAGVTLTWLDTAGIRRIDAELGGAGRIEAAGIERAQATVATADIVIWLRDRSRPTEAIAAPRQGPPDRIVLRYWSKADLPENPARQRTDGFAEASTICANDPADIERLRADLRTATMRLSGQGVAAETVLTRTRHAAGLRTAAEALERAIAALQAGQPLELPAADLHDAADALSEVTGEIPPDDVLEQIFSSFCIGK